MKELLRIPTERVARVCKVSTKEALQWRINKNIPPEYHRILEDSVGLELQDVEGTVLRVTESSNLMMLYEPKSTTGNGWKLSIVTDDYKRFVSPSLPAISLREWLVEVAMEILNVDIIWAQTKLVTGAYGKPVLEVAYTAGIPPVKLRLDTQMYMLFYSQSAKEAKLLLQEVSSCLINITQLAQQQEGLETVQELFDMADVSPKELFDKYIDSACMEWVDKYVLGTPDEDGIRQEPEAMYTTLGGVRYQGYTHFTPSTFGTYFRELGKFAEDDTILYTGSGFLQGSSFLETIDKDGLGRLVPQFPAHMSKNVYEAYLWILPDAYQIVDKGLKATGYDISHSTGLMELQLKLTEKIRTVVGSSQAKVNNPSAGITYLDDDAVTMVKINKKAFTEFSDQRKLSRPFKVFTQHFGAGAETFWAMLYSSLIPTQTCRKQALLLFGSGGSFKSTFVEKIYARMLAGTIRKTPDGQYKFTRGANTFDIVAKTRAADATSASEFGEVNTPNNVLMFFEEAINYNSEKSDYQNLKKQLGASSLTINVKYARNRKTLPVSRTVVVDSNYPPCSFEWSKESVDRAAECVLFSQYALVPPNATFHSRSDNSHLYFQKLLSADEQVEMLKILDLKGTPIEEDYLDYLAFLLFRDIVTIGKKAYEKLTGMPIKGLPVFLPFDPSKYDRKSLALSYCKLMNLSKLGRNYKEAVVTPSTTVMYFLRAGMKVSEGSFISWEEIEGLISEKFYSEIKSGFDTRRNTKKESLLWLMNTLVKGRLLSNDCIGRFIGDEMPSIRVYSDSEGVHNLGWEPWFKQVVDNNEDGEILRVLQGEVATLLQDKYLDRMNKQGLDALIPTGKGL